MPGMDKTGPLGTGPIGRGLGPCGSGRPGRRGGRGGFRQGGGAGWDRQPLVLTPDDERVVLEQQKVWLENQIGVVAQRLQELNKTKESE